jgi:3-methyladenine DNA glycosylase AlkD
MILASMVDDPHRVTERQMEEWVGDLNSWDVCDQTCMNLFDKTELAWKKVREWAEREEPFVKRAAFALIACLAWHDKEAGNDRFIALLPVIESGASDDRNFVKKSVSWALRHIGKRNTALNKAALETAAGMKKLQSRSARWIASDVIRELSSDAVKKRLKKK